MNEKKIKVLTGGLLNVPGFLYGPILTPYKEKLSVIYRLIVSGINVVEVCDDGREIVLTRDNYDVDNTMSKTPSNESPVVDSGVNNKVEEETEDGSVDTEESDETVVNENETEVI